MPEPDFAEDLTLLHLSDIHFRKGRMGDVHDVNADLRNELERDLRTFRSNRVQRLDGIIISGDVAFGGKPEEYAYAKGWIEKIRELINCPKENIMTIPGNHDVDRDQVLPGSEADGLHERIRGAASTVARDEILAAMLRDAVEGPRLLSSIAEYNKFASEYNCTVSPEHPYWERDFRLGDKMTLTIRGVTSTLISGPRDDSQIHKVVYGGAQRTFLRRDSTVRVVAGHHPPSWTLEGDDADRSFSDRCIIQLFGHKHDQWITPCGRGLRLIAGALHPDRDEPAWEPRYSLLSFHVEENGRLLIRIYPRVWSREETLFKGDYNSRGRDYRDHTIPPE